MSEIGQENDDDDVSLDQVQFGDPSDELQVSEGDTVPPSMVGCYSAR